MGGEGSHVGSHNNLRNNGAKWVPTFRYHNMLDLILFFSWKAGSHDNLTAFISFSDLGFDLHPRTILFQSQCFTCTPSVTEELSTSWALVWWRRVHCCKGFSPGAALQSSRTRSSCPPWSWGRPWGRRRSWAERRPGRSCWPGCFYWPSVKLCKRERLDYNLFI